MLTGKLCSKKVGFVSSARNTSIMWHWFWQMNCWKANHIADTRTNATQSEISFASVPLKNSHIEKYFN
jgi:hypothetical protein